MVTDFSIGKINVCKDDQHNFIAKHIDYSFTIQGNYETVKAELNYADNLVSNAMRIAYHGNQSSTVYHALMAFYWKHDCTVSVSRMIAVAKQYNAFEQIGV